MARSSILLLVLAVGAWANEITWSEFSTRVTPKHTVRMVLPGGTRIEGRPLHVKDDALELSVTRTSNKPAQAKGNASIPRASISVIEVRSPRWLGKVIGTVTPIGVAAVVGAVGAGKGDSIYLYIAAAAVIAATAPAGFFIGRAIDRRFERYTITR